MKRIWVGLILFLLLLAATALFTLKAKKIPFRKDSSAKGANCEMVRKAVGMLASGNIVLRMGRGADSYMLSQFNQKNRNYSHCGIVMIENGYPFVYHSIGGEDNPDERLRRDSASFFFSPEHNFAIAVVAYDLAATQVDSLRTVVRRYYDARPLFDLKFDLATDDKLYCAEFVYKALNKAVNDPAYIHTSQMMGYTFAGVDDLYLNKHCKIIWQTKFK